MTTTPTQGEAAAVGPAPQTAAGDNGGATDIGITGTELRVGTIATLSGPVPGLFAGAVTGTQAWAAYQNSLGGIHGRKIKVDVRDDQFDTGQNRAQTIDAIGKDFALVGSFSLYDDAAVHEIERGNVTDIQIPLTTGLQQSPNNFAINPVRRGTPTGPWNLLKQKFPTAVAKVGAVYPDIASAKDSYENNRAAMQALGYTFVYQRAYQATETDFTADVVRMRSARVQFFFTNGDVKTAARLAKAMAAQNLKPAAFVVFGTAYDAQFPALAGAAGEGVLNVGGQAMYLGEDAPFNPEVRLFLEWLHRVKPGYTPDLFAAYGWGSGRLFAKAAQDAGPKLTRARLLAAMRTTDDWNGYGLFPSAGPASKRPATCFILEVVHNGKFERWNSPPPGFNCAGSTFFTRP
jgi:ABC-type branched-subunit amino acid transport system substrate-binding protein